MEPTLRIARRCALRWVLAGALGATFGCGRLQDRPFSPASVAPAPVARTGCDAPPGSNPHRPGASRASRPVRICLLPCQGEPRPEGVQVRWGETVVKLGAGQDWCAELTGTSVNRSLLRITPWQPTVGAVRVSPVGELPSELVLTLLPRIRPQPPSPYSELMDLLVELVRPFDSTIVRRWPVEVLRVQTPPDTLGVDYGAACLQAIDLWNAALGSTRLIGVAAAAPAEVRTTLSLEPRLAYTMLTDWDAEGRPLAMRVHVSPRLVEGADRYARRIYLHELGHVLGLWGHSRDRRHVMNGVAVTVDEPSNDEARVTRWLWSLPSGTDLAWYVRDLPAREPNTSLMTVPLNRSARSKAVGIAASRRMPP